MRLPEPLDLPWALKPVSSAVSGRDTLPDGREKFWVRHEVLKGVTPRMLVWWFGHLEGDMEVRGRRYPRYRVWHPLDHVAIRYTRRLLDGSIGPGAVIHLQEVLGRNPRYSVDVHTRIEKLDEEGFVHLPALHGLEVARAEYTFRRLPDGTLYENCLIVGRPGTLGRLLTRALIPFAFPAGKGEAWLKHNIEEVGMFENFLPDLYRAETGRSE